METVAFEWGLKVRSVQEDVWPPSAHAVGIVTDPTSWGQPQSLALLPATPVWVPGRALA